MSKLVQIIVISLLFLGAACGPVKSTSAIRKARQAIREAETAGAQKSASYQFALAQEYYNKAREEAGYSKYQVATTLAEKAQEYAIEALKVGAKKKKQPAPPLVKPNPE